MEEMVVRLKLAPNADPEVFRSLAMQMFQGMTGYVAHAEVDYADPEELREAIRFEGGGPSLEETSRFYLRIGPEVRLQVGRLAYGLFALFLERGVVREGKRVLDLMKQRDPEAWKHAELNTLTATYSRMANRLAKSPWPLIRGRKGVYGFKHQEAVTKAGKKSPKNRDFEEEI